MLTIVQEHKELIWWVAVFSGVVFVGSLVIVPWLIVRIPSDYFATGRRPRTSFADNHPLLRWSGLILKNLIGVLLMLAGIAMLLLPGQGLLTLAIGLLLLDFPHKHRVERRIIRIQPVWKSINWLRQKAGVGPLHLEPAAPRTPETS